MHEISIVMSMLDIVAEQCRQGGYSKVSAIKVRIGKASAIMAEALEFAFTVARENTVAADARLEIEEIPLGGTCRSCGAETDVADAFSVTCPVCRQGVIAISRGHELNLVEMEVD